MSNWMSKTLFHLYFRWVCKHTRFSSTHFLRFPGFEPSAGTRPASGYSGTHGGAHCYIQPALCNSPRFIQHSEQIKIQYFCLVRPVEPFDKGILRWLTRPDKVQHHPAFSRPLCQGQRHQFRSVIHPHLQRISTVYRYPCEHPFPPFGILRSISITSASRLKSSTTLKVRKRLPQTSASRIKSIDQLWFNASGVASGAGLRTGKRGFPLRRKFSFNRQ